MSDATTTDVHHPLFARVYARLGRHADRHGAAQHRDALLERLRGRVIEVGAGHGLNFARYPATVDEVLAVEPEPHLRRLARDEARRVPTRVEVVAGVAEALPAEDASFDVAVASLVLCSVRDPDRALAELRRVLRPGGELRFYEHVVADRGRLASIQRRLDDWRLWPTVAGGCHVARDTVGALGRAGFVVERCERFPFPPGRLALPHVLGAARRP